MLIPHGTMIALADGEKLTLFRNAGTDAQLKLASMPSPTIEAHSKDSGKRHHVSAANPQGNQLEEDSFAAAVADWLNTQALEGKFDHVVVVAPPRLLGEMRRNYHKALTAKLVGELSKDLMDQTVEAIERDLTAAKPSGKK